MAHGHEGPYANPVNSALSQVKMTSDRDRSALVVIYPQIDVVSPKTVSGTECDK